MSLKRRLLYASKENNVLFHVIERDYLLSLTLESISRVPLLRENTLLKGGTALKKMYDEKYRFSEDLDFTVIGQQEYLKNNLPELMEHVCAIATERRKDILEDEIEITSAPYLGNRPHPEGQLAFGVRAKYSWHREHHTVIYAEFTFNELVVTEPVVRKILHPYDDPCDGELYVYSLEEIAGEKIRALLQFAKKLHERGWSRSRVRDYFDLWKILTAYSHGLNLELIPEVAKRKCEFKDLVFRDIEDIFNDVLMLHYEDNWEQWLRDMMIELPDKDNVLTELKATIIPLFRNFNY